MPHNENSSHTCHTGRVGVHWWQTELLTGEWHTPAALHQGKNTSTTAYIHAHIYTHKIALSSVLNSIMAQNIKHIIRINLIHCNQHLHNTPTSYGHKYRQKPHT